MKDWFQDKMNIFGHKESVILCDYVHWLDP